MKMHCRTLVLLATSVVVALIAWPYFGSGTRARAARPAAAAVTPDYKYRDKTIAFYERKARNDPQDQISARILAGQYLQRYRESGDVEDIRRAIAQAQRSITLQPANNVVSYELLASADTALHRFRDALGFESHAARVSSGDSNAYAQMASLNMELGRYDRANEILRRAQPRFPADAGILSVRARYDELAGHLAQARDLIDKASIIEDSVVDNSAQARAWFHFRAGEMAFSAGDAADAQQDERDALGIFPNFAPAYNSLARFCWAVKDWKCALDAATAGADVVPLPETLGYKADAQRALGDARSAARTQDLIFAIERIGNAYHMSDRLLAVYYAEHHLRKDDALKIAQREVGVRGDEIYAQDTLAWAAAMDNRWYLARMAIREALRYNTEDSRLQFHAGMIALHFGDKAEAAQRLERALQLNPNFHPIYADQARKALATL